MMTSSWHQQNILMHSHLWSLVVTRGHSWSLVVYLWSPVVTRGHSWSLVCTFTHDPIFGGEKRQPEIRLRSQANSPMAQHLIDGFRQTSVFSLWASEHSLTMDSGVVNCLITPNTTRHFSRAIFFTFNSAFMWAKAMYIPWEIDFHGIVNSSRTNCKSIVRQVNCRLQTGKRSTHHSDIMNNIPLAGTVQREGLGGALPPPPALCKIK